MGPLMHQLLATLYVTSSIDLFTMGVSNLTWWVSP
jgi:hypothetical protein